MAVKLVRAGFGGLLLLLALPRGPCTPPAQGEVLHTVTINITGDLDAGPVSKVTVKVTPLSGGKVRVVEQPRNRTPQTIMSDGVYTDASGRVVVIVEPGEYKVTVTHPNFVTSQFRMELDPEVPVDERDMVCDWTIRVRPEFGARWIVAEVYARPNPAVAGGKPERFGELKLESPTGEGLKFVDLAVPVRLLEWITVTKAQVTVFDEAGWSIESGLTNARGFVNMKSPGFVIGDVLTVRAEAPGHIPGSRQIMVGSAQATLTPEQLGGISDTIGLAWVAPAGTSKWDVARVVMTEETTTPVGALLVVEANDQASGAPVGGASVQVLTASGAVLGERLTGADGKAGGVAVRPGPDGKQMQGIRVIVRRDGYEDAWSDVPDELLESSADPRLYLVHLKKPRVDSTTNPFSGTWECGELAIGPVVLTQGGTKLTGTWGANEGKLQGTWDEAKRQFKGTWTQKPGKTPDPFTDGGSFTMQMGGNGIIGGLWHPGPGEPTSGYMFTLTRKR